MPLDLIQISEPETGSRATIAVGQGFNCFEFQTRRAGQTVDVLWAHPEFAHGGQRPSGSGIPLLFPFAGRLAGTSFEYNGRTYQLEEGDGRGNAIHGFVMRRAWRVIEHSPHRVVGQFHAALDDPALLDQWPSDFRIQVAYELRQGALVSEIVIDNPASTPLPFGFATHAYFRLPPVAGGPAADCVATAPVHGQWELENLIPTGRKLPESTVPPLAAGLVVGPNQFDNAFTDLTFTDGRAATRVFDPASGRTVVQTFDDSFRNCVVYIPPHREAICLEPYTHLPNPFQLEAAGVPTGFRTLALGEAYRTRIVINVE